MLQAVRAAANLRMKAARQETCETRDSLRFPFLLECATIDEEGQRKRSLDSIKKPDTPDGESLQRLQKMEIDKRG